MAVTLVCFGFCAVILDVVSNINAALVEKELNRAVMSGLHGLYSVGGFLGPLIVTTLLSTWLGITGSAIFSAVFVVLFTYISPDLQFFLLFSLFFLLISAANIYSVKSRMKMKLIAKSKRNSCFLIIWS